MIIERRLDIDVLTAAKRRIKNIFDNDLPVYLDFSGGKDSLVLAHIVGGLIEQGDIDPAQLTVRFIDEEGIFPCVERVVTDWGERFVGMGAAFEWYAIEVKHFNCLNQLENDESFYCFDRLKRDVWIREPPKFALRTHPLLRPRDDTYQKFLHRIVNGPSMTGLRVFESVQRRIAVASKDVSTLGNRPTIEPIYDWQDSDVWLYLKEHDIEIPDAYMHLYQLGVSPRALRISQFFSVDTAYVLARISEFYPGLMERVLRREPAANIVSLYWDSEMFRRRTATRKALEAEAKTKAGKAEVMALLRNINGNFKTVAQRRLALQFRRMILMKPYMRPIHFELIHDCLIAGDPKNRTYRAIFAKIEHDCAADFNAGTGFVIDSDATGAGSIRATSGPRRSQAK